MCGLFQIPAQPSISAAQGSQLYLNRPGAKYQRTLNRVSGMTSLFLSHMFVNSHLTITLYM